MKDRFAPKYRGYGAPRRLPNVGRLLNLAASTPECPRPGVKPVRRGRQANAPAITGDGISMFVKHNWMGTKCQTTPTLNRKTYDRLYYERVIRARRAKQKMIADGV